jgi:hypothetical protein
MELKLNEEPLFNVQLLLNNMQHHEMLSSNTNQSKFALFVNSKNSVLFKLIQLVMFNNMVLNFLMLQHLFNKLVLLVSLKISHHLLALLLVTVQAHTVKNHSVLQPDSNLLVLLVVLLDLVVDSEVLHHLNHLEATHQVVLKVVLLVVLLDLVVDSEVPHHSNHHHSNHHQEVLKEV